MSTTKQALLDKYLEEVSSLSSASSATTSKRALERDSDVESVSSLNSPPPKKQKVEYKVFHITSGKRVFGSSTKHESSTPGVAFVFPQAREEEGSRHNGTYKEHWHCIVKVPVSWVDQQKARKQKIIPDTSMCKEITSYIQFDNAVEYIRAKLNRQWTFDEKKRISDMRKLVHRKLKRMGGDRDYGKREQLVTKEYVDNLWEQVEEDPEDMSLVRRYFKAQKLLLEHEALLKKVSEEREKRQPLTSRNLLVMLYDLFSCKSTFKLLQLIDIHKKRQLHPVKCGKTPIYFLIGETSCGKTKIANAFANIIGRSDFPITGYQADDKLAFSRWWGTGSDVLVFDDFDFNMATRRGNFD